MKHTRHRQRESREIVEKQYDYASEAGTPGSETVTQRETRERYWKSLGKKVRKGARL